MNKGVEVVFHNLSSYNTATILSIYQSFGLSIMRAYAQTATDCTTGGYYENNV